MQILNRDKITWQNNQVVELDFFATKPQLAGIWNPAGKTLTIYTIIFEEIEFIRIHNVQEWKTKFFITVWLYRKKAIKFFNEISNEKWRNRVDETYKIS